MKFFHLSDLHLGKRLNNYSLYEDQKYILKKIMEYAEAEKPDAVLIAGDVYDKAVPPAESVTLLDDFLTALADQKIPVLLISGNHDSAERNAYGARLFKERGIYLSRMYDGKKDVVVLEDAYGPVNFYLLPFIRAAHVRRALIGDDFSEEMLLESNEKEEEIKNSEDAVRKAISLMEVNPSERNVILSHQFVTGASVSDSEEGSYVGGIDNVGAEVFDDFDYAALGHIHKPQQMKEGRVRYCGTPLKYSVSEEKDEKSITVVELKEKGNISYRFLPLEPLHELKKLKGTFQELIQEEVWKEHENDYVQICLTDEQEIPDCMRRLKNYYKLLLGLEYDNTRTRANAVLERGIEDIKKNPMELFAEFFLTMNANSMTEEQSALVNRLITEIQEGEGR